MAEENIEETIDNLGEGETPIEETPIGDEETPEKPSQADSELERKNKELYARARRAEEEAKRLKADFTKEQPKAEQDVFDLAKTVSSLRDFSEDELDFISMMAKAKNLSPQQAAKTEEAKLYVAALREKVAVENKIPSPSSPGGVSYNKQVSPDMKGEEVDKILQERFKETQQGRTGV